MVHGDSRPFGNAQQWFFSDLAGYAGHFREELIEISQEGSPARHHDPLIHDIRGELGRRFLQNCLDSGNNFV